jgi:phosphoribosylformylglycinamidine synthase subunit PurQ / glutaminase
MAARFGVLRFPGSCDEVDAKLAAERVGEAELLAHTETDLKGFDAIVVPGGFSYGDYLRAGAIASNSPIMRAVTEFAAQGGLVLGICNGFQVLCEAGLLPGALLSNVGLRFVCRQARLEVLSKRTPFTADLEIGTQLSIPIKHTTGRYYASEDTLGRMRESGQIVLRYVDDDPNGSSDRIAGVCNEEGNVFGLMPHPEHAVSLLAGPSADGLRLFQSAAASLLEKAGV